MNKNYYIIKKYIHINEKSILIKNKQKNMNKNNHGEKQLMKINTNTIENYTQSIANQNTRKSNRHSLNKFVKFLENKEITDVTQDNINTVFRDYQAHLNKLKIKASTRNQHLIILKTFINEYTNIEYDKKLKLERTINEPKYLTPKQIQTIYKYTENPLDELMIKLLSNTGLRISEALNITKKELTDLDGEGNVILKVIGKRNKKKSCSDTIRTGKRTE